MTRARALRFVAASGLAACANVGSRILFENFMPFEAAIVLAFGVGLLTAFALNRRYVFNAPSRPLWGQVGWFVTINLFGLAQTLFISLLLARLVLPALSIDWHAEEIAHVIGVAAPAASSYWLHGRLTFRRSVA